MSGHIWFITMCVWKVKIKITNYKDTFSIKYKYYKLPSGAYKPVYENYLFKKSFINMYIF